MSRSPVTTHVLDTARGRPAAGVSVTLEAQAGSGWRELASKATDADGRIMDWLPPSPRLAPGVYRVRFDTAAYHTAQGQEIFYPEVAIAFTIQAPEEHFHVPLLISPYGFSTYRGS